MAKLRLSTEGRFILSGFSEMILGILRQGQWLVAGDLANGQHLVLVPVKQGGLKVAKDGRLHVANGQDKFQAHEEMVLGEIVDIDGVIRLYVEEREAPTLEKTMHMMARPVKPPSMVARVDPGEMHLFEDL